MRAVAQRVKQAWVDVGADTVGRIEHGLLVYLGAGRRDDESSASWMAEKLVSLRIFEDDAGKMSRDVRDAGGQCLVVPQFTLYGDMRRGRRPSFDDAAPPEVAERLYEQLVEQVRCHGVTVATGRFRVDMQVHAQVDGPVTILIDSEKTF